MDRARVFARKEFKSPPTGRLSQQARREQALEEQKRRRLERIDASRQLEHFADLHLGLSDGEVDNEDGADVDGSEAKEGVAEQVELINDSDEAKQRSQAQARSSSGAQLDASEKSHCKKAKKGRNRGKRKASKWANKCMYAELLEMHAEALSTDDWNINGTGQHDGLPSDLETSWVGLAPIPLGKRCLAVTMQSAGVSGIVPNTILRSRLLGKVLLRPFPSPLPPNTILDCILDENWQSNGILHVLDVIRWKSQDVGGCEAKFRFWWRDTRLSEIPAWPPPYLHEASFPHVEGRSVLTYRFPYPTTFIPVPYATPTTYGLLLDDLLLRARNGRGVRVRLPLPLRSERMHPGHVIGDEDMQIDQPIKASLPRGTWSCDQVQEAEVRIMSDGMLLYVAEASYDSGESPLSVWVPRTAFERRTHDRATDGGPAGGDAAQMDSQQGSSGGSPLDLFERLIRRRLAHQGTRAAPGMDAEMGLE